MSACRKMVSEPHCIGILRHFFGTWLVAVVVRVVIAVVVVVVFAQVDVIENDAEDLRAYVLEELPGAADDVARGLTAVDDEENAVNEGGGKDAVGERADGGGVDDDVREGAFESSDQPAHLLGADKLRGVRRYCARCQDVEARLFVLVNRREHLGIAQVVREDGAEALLVTEAEDGVEARTAHVGVN